MYFYKLWNYTILSAKIWDKFTGESMEASESDFKLDLCTIILIILHQRIVQNLSLFRDEQSQTIHFLFSFKV